MLEIFDRRESEARSYIRAFPALFERAVGSCLFDAQGRRYLDFFAGAGALNYGHNDPGIKQAVIAYLQADGVVHGLDMATSARQRFHAEFERVVLQPRGLQYKVQFPGPTGANAVEAAIKLARLVTQRRNIIAFTSAYHGVTLGALSVTGGRFYRHPAYTQTADVTFMPYDGYFGPTVDTLAQLRRLLQDGWSGLDLPAGVLVELVQAEGGVNIPSPAWVQGLAALCREFGMLLIVDDIQMGNGRTGTFFSFESHELVPDVVLLSKSIGGGLPLSVLLMKPELDQWQPGQHNGTFRANNLALVAATAALRHWETPAFSADIRRKGQLLAEALSALVARHQALDLVTRGVGLLHCVEFVDPALARAVARAAFDNGLVIELCGARGAVLKCMPPLVISDAELLEGAALIEKSVQDALSGTSREDRGQR